MIIIISSQGNSIESPVNERFGRSPFLIKVDTETMAWEGFENPGINRSGGAGVAAAQFVIDHKAELVMSGDFGPNASSALNAAGITMKVFENREVTVRQVVEKIKNAK